MLGKNIKKLGIEYLYFLLITIFTIFTSYKLYVLQYKLSNSIIQVVYNQTEAILDNISKEVKGKSYKELDNYLPIILSKDMQRVFVLLYKNGIFYSIEDLPRIRTHAPILFMPQDDEKDIILKAIKTNSAQIEFHNNIFNVGFSLYHPTDLYYNGKIYKGIIVVDYRLSTLKNLSHTLEYVRLSIIFISALSIGLLIIMGFLFLKAQYYKSSSYIDTLTSIPNRKILKDLRKIFKDGLVVALLDIDFFKKINDTYGHDIGDITLKEVANTIKNSIRENDIVIRYGGEEFLIILDCIHPEKCVKTLERIRIRVEALELSINNTSLSITVSIGVCIKGKDLEDCIKKADIALYKAKNSGRNRIEVFDEESK